MFWYVIYLKGIQTKNAIFKNFNDNNNNINITKYHSWCFSMNNKSLDIT